MRKLTVLLTVLLLAAAAHADVVLFSGARYDVVITDPVPVGSGAEGLVGFTLKFLNTTGDAGYDAGSVDGVYFGYTGISGELHQHNSAALEPISPTTDKTYATAIDTHFAQSSADMLVVSTPTEDNGVAPSTEPSDAPPPFDGFGGTSFGTFLTGTWAVDAAASFELAYIVIADPGLPLVALPFGTGLVHNDFFISGTKGGEIFQFDIGVPEPATMGLLSVGGIAALLRAALLRRRKK